MDFGRPGEAVAKFETSLIRMPNRARSLLGIGRAYVALGQPHDGRLCLRDHRGDVGGTGGATQGMQEAREFWRMHLTGRDHTG